MSQSRLSRTTRKDGQVNTEPFEFKRQPTVEFGRVNIGNHAPGDHYAPVAQQWVPEKELYQPRKRG